MPSTPKKPRAKSPIRQQARYDPQRGAAPPEMIDLVDPVWILKALGGVFAFAILCAYLTICILFSRSQWQLVLHPVRNATTTPASLDLSFTPVHFGVDATGQPRINGWWIPAEALTATTDPSSSATPTVLFLHSGDGSMSNALAQAANLRSAHLNVLLFDYRGFGLSAGLHPTEASMQTDAETALSYLTTTRRLPISSIVVFGTGLGASLAVHLCAAYPALPALIIQSPQGDLAATVRQDPRTRLVPFRLLFDEDFALAKPLQRLSTPRLVLSSDVADDTQSIHRFLDTTLHR